MKRCIAFFLFWSMSTAYANTGFKDVLINIAAPDKAQLFNKQSPIRQLVDNHFENYLPQYKLAFVSMTFERFWLDVQQGKDICHLFASPRITDSYTLKSTRATLLYPMPSVVMPKSISEKLELPANATAEDILNTNTLFGGYNAGRRYPTYVNDILVEKSMKQKSSLFGGHFSIKRLHDMTISGRLDYFIGLPNALPFVSGVSVEQFDIFEFKVKDPTELYIVCSFSQKNRRFLADFDRTAFNWYHDEMFNTVWQFTFPFNQADNKQRFSQFVEQQMAK